MIFTQSISKIVILIYGLFICIICKTKTTSKRYHSILSASLILVNNILHIILCWLFSIWIIEDLFILFILFTIRSLVKFFIWCKMKIWSNSTIKHWWFYSILLCLSTRGSLYTWMIWGLRFFLFLLLHRKSKHSKKFIVKLKDSILYKKAFNLYNQH